MSRISAPGLAKALAGEADEVDTAQDEVAALALFRKEHHHLVITDLKMVGPRPG